MEDIGGVIKIRVDSGAEMGRLSEVPTTTVSELINVVFAWTNEIECEVELDLDGKIERLEPA